MEPRALRPLRCVRAWSVATSCPSQLTEKKSSSWEIAPPATTMCRSQHECILFLETAKLQIRLSPLAQRRRRVRLLRRQVGTKLASTHALADPRIALDARIWAFEAENRLQPQRTDSAHAIFCRARPVVCAHSAPSDLCVRARSETRPDLRDGKLRHGKRRKRPGGERLQ